MQLLLCNVVPELMVSGLPRIYGERSMPMIKQWNTSQVRSTYFVSEIEDLFFEEAIA
ncbi:MAG: hypothetical protein QXU18_09170 [Thermoplasmatales archaeon]